MQEKELSLDEATKVWWAWAWRLAVVTIPLHLIVGYIVTRTEIQTFGVDTWILFIADLVLSIYFLRSAINKNYGDFRVLAVGNTDNYEENSTA
jgi:hypothetical protein